MSANMMTLRRRHHPGIEGKGLEESVEDVAKATWVELNFRKRECCKFVPSFTAEGFQRCGCGRLLSGHDYLYDYQASQDLPAHKDSFSTTLKLDNEVKASQRLLSGGTSRVKSTESSPLFYIETTLTPKHRKSKRKASSLSPIDSKWNAVHHTIALPTDAFGTLEYQGSGEGDKSQYIRLAYDTHPELVLRFLTEQWGLHKPKMVITVHGGVHNFQLQPKLQRVFCDGLIKAAKTTGAWIMLFGLNTGVGAIVGNALKEHKARSRGKIYSIGVAPWGVVDNRDDLIGSQAISSYQTMTNPLSKGAVLSAAHTHFLLADNGTEGKYGTELKFRRRLERKLSSQQISPRHSRKIPVVCLVLEGGKSTINIVLESVRQNPPIPVIIVDGSGRAADLIAFAHQYAEDDGTMMEDLRLQFLGTIQNTFACEREQAQFIFLTIMECVRRRHLITVFRLGQGQSKHADFDNTILTASLKAARASAPDMLSLALSWNRIDIATSQIFVYGQHWPVLSLEQAMMDALTQDRTDFVKLMMENGVSMHKFLTIPRLEELYNIKQIPIHLLYLLQDVKKSITLGCRFNLIEIGQVIESLMGGAYRCNYTRKRFRLYYAAQGKSNIKKHGSFSKHLLPSSFSKLDLISSSRDYSNLPKTTSLKIEPESNKDNSSVPPQIPKDFQYPFHELMVWAVLMKRQKMALFMWQHGEEAIAKALVAATLYRAMTREAADDELDLEEMEELRRYSGEFADLATQLLEICYRADTNATQHLLTYQLKQWSKQTCITLAIAAQHREFIAHPCVQLLLNDLWMGGLNVRKNSSLRVILGLLCPPSIFMLQFKSLEQLQLMPQTMEEHMDERNDSSSVSSSSSSSLSSSSTSSSSSSSSSGSSISGFQHKPKVVCRGVTGLDQSDQLTKDPYLVFMVQQRQLTPSMKIYEFYNAPITKFWLYTISYNAFLVLFTYVVLVSMSSMPSAMEWFVVSYVFTLTLEKIREIVASEPSGAFKKIKLWLNQFWHQIDVILLLMFFSGFVLRMMQQEYLLKVGRALYCVNVSLWYIRLLNIFSVSKYLGPYVMMMGKMMVDLGTFIILVAVVLISFGVTRQALLHPNEVASWSLVRDVFLQPYFMLYGEVYAGAIDPCSKGNNDTLCVVGSWIVPTAMTLYLLVANILLLNMLIAVFNNTFTKVKNISDQIWKFHRYGMIVEYEFRPMFPPPFIILSYIVMIFRYCFKKRKNSIFSSDRGLKLFLDDEDVEKLHDFEEDCLDDLFRQKMLKKDENQDYVDSRPKVSSNHLERLLDYMDDSAERDDIIASQLQVLEDRLVELEETNMRILNVLPHVADIKLNTSERSHSERCTSDEANRVTMKERIKFRSHRIRQDSEMSTFSDWHPSNMLLKRFKSQKDKKRERHASERVTQDRLPDYKIRKTISTGNILMNNTNGADSHVSSEVLSVMSHQYDRSRSALARILIEPEQKSVSCQELLMLKEGRKISHKVSFPIHIADNALSGNEFLASDIIKQDSPEETRESSFSKTFGPSLQAQKLRFAGNVTMVQPAPTDAKFQTTSANRKFRKFYDQLHDSSSGSESSSSSICDKDRKSVNLRHKRVFTNLKSLKKRKKVAVAMPTLVVNRPDSEKEERIWDLTPIADESPMKLKDCPRESNTYSAQNGSREDSTKKRRVSTERIISKPNSSKIGPAFQSKTFSNMAQSRSFPILSQSQLGRIQISPQTYNSNQSYKSITDCIDTSRWHDANSNTMQPPLTPHDMHMWWNKPPDFLSHRQSKSSNHALERLSQDEWEDEPEAETHQRSHGSSHQRGSHRRTRLNSNSSSTKSVSRRRRQSIRKHRQKRKTNTTKEEVEDSDEIGSSQRQSNLVTVQENSSTSLKQQDEDVCSFEAPTTSSNPFFNINNSNFQSIADDRKSSVVDNTESSFLKRYANLHSEEDTHYVNGIDEHLENSVLMDETKENVAESGNSPLLC